MMSAADPPTPALPETHWQQQMQWNRPLPARVRSCIHHEIERQVVTRPNKIAVASSNSDLMYSDLDRIAASVASRLCEHGVGLEVIVPLCFDKSPWMIVAILAVLKAGGAFVALDPKAPSSRTDAMLDDLEAKVIVTEPNYRHLFVGSGVDVLALSDADLPTFSQSKVCTARASNPNNAAYVIFTSGSTGKPKGVVVEHQSFCSGMALHAPAQSIDQRSRVLQFASYTHDTCIVEILTTLCMGGTICSPSEDERVNGLAEFINAQRVNWAVLTPSFIASIDPHEVPTLETVVLAGERLSQSHINGWASCVRLLSGYGVSECSVVTTISNPADRNRSASNIGMPAGGICWIVDPENTDRLLPIGTVGEILIEGPTVARGYLRNPEATQRAFIGPPVWLRPILEESDPESRLYRTGDLGRYNSDGTLDFVSRLDSQVKVAGRRIELGEVEHYVSSHPSVRLCMVLLPRSGDYANYLVAVVELHDKQDTLEDELHVGGLLQNAANTQDIEASVRTMAPGYMVPTFWFLVTRFPRLPSAKLDRRKICIWLEDRRMTEDAVGADDMVPLDDTVGRQIARELAFLQLPQGQILDSRLCLQNKSLRRAGIDSIKAITLRKAIYRLFGIKIPVACFMDEGACPTSLAEHIRRAQKLGQREYIPSELDLNAELDRLKLSLEAKITTAPVRSIPPSTRSSTILLTGAAGYLGQEILKKLLEARHRVVVLVRAPSVEDARKRLVDRAVDGGWWSPTYEGQLKIWLGDLSQADIGLQSESLARLSGSACEHDCIHAVIHNGARVHWTESAKGLWSVNVNATVRLLEIALASRWIHSFVYVSGGNAIGESISEWLASAQDGYSQTKLLSQALVQHCARRSKDQLGLKISAVKPGFIIGAPDGGVANPSDYLWRFVASAIELDVYDGERGTARVALSTLPLVAETVILRLSPSSSKEYFDVIEDSLQEKDIWEAVRSLGYSLRPVSHATWVTRLQDAVDAQGETHLLWPLASILEKQAYGLGQDHSGPPSDGERGAYLRHAVCQNIKSLINIEFIRRHPAPNDYIVAC